MTYPPLHQSSGSTPNLTETKPSISGAKPNLSEAMPFSGANPNTFEANPSFLLSNIFLDQTQIMYKTINHVSTKSCFKPKSFTNTI